MRVAVMTAPGDVRVEDRPDPTIIEPTDAIIRLAADLRLRVGPVALPRDRAARRATADGPRVRRHRRGGRQRGHHDQAGPVRRRLVLRLRQHLRDLPGRLPDLLRAPGVRRTRRRPGRTAARPAGRRHPGRHPGACPTDDLVPSLLAASDVLGTGWFAAVAAEVGPGKTVAVVGDGAVGLLGVLAAKQLGAERIIAMSRHEPRQKLALEFGATDIVTERGDDGVARDQGPHRRARRALGDRGRRHPGVDDAGHPLHPPRRARRLRRRRPRRRAARHGAVLLPRPPARRPRPGTPLPARPDRPDLEPRRSTRARSSTSTCRSTRPPRATGRWTSAAPSRSCSAPDPANSPATRRATHDATATDTEASTARSPSSPAPPAASAAPPRWRSPAEGAASWWPTSTQAGNRGHGADDRGAGGRALAVALRRDPRRRRPGRARPDRRRRSAASTSPSTTPASSSSPSRPPTSPRTSGTGSSPSTCAACSCA